VTASEAEQNISRVTSSEAKRRPSSIAALHCLFSCHLSTEPFLTPRESKYKSFQNSCLSTPLLQIPIMATHHEDIQKPADWPGQTGGTCHTIPLGASDFRALVLPVALRSWYRYSSVLHCLFDQACCSHILYPAHGRITPRVRVRAACEQNNRSHILRDSS
jgi:hypothetical protein